MKPQGLLFKQFIRRLLTMEVCIPFLGNPGEVFMLFQSGSGYNPSPKGPSCPFISRESDEWVPLKEIQDTLRLLEVNVDVFWSIEDHIEKEPQPATGSTGPRPLSERPAITKPEEPK